jgi:hypothetical protein
MKYSYAERQKILREAHATLARLRLAECIDGLRQERLELQREVAHDRAFQQLQLERKLGWPTTSGGGTGARA